VHHVVRNGNIQLAPALPGHSSGYSRFSAVDRSHGSVHTAIEFLALEAGGHVENHVQSYEEYFFVTDGEPVLIMDGKAYPLAPGACGIIPIGTPHGWRGPKRGKATWLAMLTPIPRGADGPQDVFFLGPSPEPEVMPLDLRDPRTRQLFKVKDDDINVDKLKLGSRVDAPEVSASMATALLAYSGIALKMLVDQRLAAALGTMFILEYQPGAVAHPHDHPFEEAYVIFDGEVEAHADGKVYDLQKGDVMWTGVGCIHAFYNRKPGTVKWLETQSPAPPVRNSYRFNREWDYLAEKLGPSSR
jgi:quercetin dioxygenase-like cupin family protein